MKFTLTYLPFAISFLNGALLIKLLLKDAYSKAPLFHLSLAAALGLGISAYIGLINFLVFNRYDSVFQIGGNLLVCGLAILGVFLSRNNEPKNEAGFPKNVMIRDTALCFSMFILCIPLYYLATFYPFGGWDAWAVWHFKAKFLFLSGDGWRSIFDPILWRSSPHYPLLLPLINVWGWSFQELPIYQVPLFTSILFTFLSIALVISSLHLWTRNKFTLLIAIVLFSSPFFTKTSISQYADVVLGFYLLASLICIILAKKESEKSYAFLGGLFIGFLSFCKPEGLIAALILSGLTFFLIGWSLNNKSNKDRLIAFLIGAAMTMVPSLLFYFFVAPTNVTSINGFFSNTDPTSLLRFKTVLMFYAIELVSFKWNGLWIVLLFAILFGAKKAFHKETFIVPAFLFLYILAITLYYGMNTYFEILWWLSVTLNRILASMLPVVLWWVFVSLWNDKESDRAGA